MSELSHYPPAETDRNMRRDRGSRKENRVGVESDDAILSWVQLKVSCNEQGQNLQIFRQPLNRWSAIILEADEDTDCHVDQSDELERCCIGLC
jgi:hypothetical protein